MPHTVFIECHGDRTGPRFLNGLTLDGTVGLAPHTGDPFTGAWWTVKLAI